MKRRGKIFGIDLGTTFSAIAVINDYGKAELIPNNEGERLTPSVVLFDEESVVVGRVAALEAPAQPDRIVDLVKRHMGDADWLREFDGLFYRPQDISALILKKLRQDAERWVGEEVEEAVITVPAYFSDTQRFATREAADLAGLQAVRIINEPTAAALAFGLQESEAQGSFFVFDLGGGTFDVTLLEIDKGLIQVRATNGNAELGGKDWDDALIHELALQFSSRYGLDPLDDPIAYRDLRQRVSNAKHILSQRAQTTLSFSYEGFTIREELTRERFESLTANLLGQCEDLCQLVLEDARRSWEELEAILLVGGATRMPMIRQMLQRIAHKEPQASLHPDEIVCAGAAIQGALCWLDRSGEGPLSPQQKSYHTRLRQIGGRVAARDVTSHGLGLIALDAQGREFVDNLIPKHAPLPSSRFETYYTAYDHQTSIEVRVMEGESESPEECIPIGSCELDGIPPRPSGQRVEVGFHYDADGILTVEVMDQGTNQRRQIEIRRRSGRPSQEFERMRRSLLSRRIEG